MPGLHEPVPYASLRLLADAVALGSLSAAAEKSGVTASAVSHRIAALEDWIGAQLLDRRVRRARPTALGAMLVRGIGPAFDGIEKTVAAIRRAGDGERVLISAPPALAAVRLHPIAAEVRGDLKIELRPIGFDAPVLGDPVDIAVRFLHDGPPEARLGTPGWTAVCSRRQWEAAGKPRRADELRDVPLLHEAVFNFWPRCVAPTTKAPTHHFVPLGDALSIYAAVLSGRGAALLPREIVRPALQEGQLVALDGGNVEPDAAYYASLTDLGEAHGSAADVLARMVAAFQGASKSV